MLVDDITREERERVRRLVDAVGESAAARRLGLAVPSVLRIALGRAVRRGTVALLRQALAAQVEVGR